MSDTVKVRINGRSVEAPAGSTILELARQEGFHIPTLCYSPLLRPLENCRLCVVRVEGEKQYKAACSTKVTQGMDITTEGEDLQKTRKLLLELLLDTHYGDCVAPCTLTCPANVDIQGYLALIRHGEYREAVRLVKQKIPMPATISRVCPHTCETACRRKLVEEPVNINHCKRFLADFEMNSGERVLPDLPPLSSHRVAVIGGGPAGLSAAYYLRSLGHGATIFEARDKLGGMLRYGIPEYRLPKKVLDWEIDGILSLGIEVKTGVRWGKDFTLLDLRNQGFDALCLAIGAWATRKLGIVGEDLKGVDSGVEFLEQFADRPPSQIKVGKHIAIIGGGNVAIDAARSSLRLGAKKVSILYRRSRNEMPANHEEIEAAQEEGIDIQFLVAPTQLFDENGSVKKLRYLRMELGEPDASGRRRPVPIEGSEMTIEVDQVITAIGQYPDIPLPDSDKSVADLPLTRWSTIGGDPRTMHTGDGMVFVCGDVFRGPATVVEALADGRKSAYSLDRYFRSGEVQPEPLLFNISKGDLKAIDPEPFSVMKTISRESIPELEVTERSDNFKEVAFSFEEEQLRKEASRCLSCGCSAAFDCRLRELMNEFQVDWRDQPSKKIHYQRVAAVDVHPLISLDPNKCIRCERCHVACATHQGSDAIELREWPRLTDRCVDCGLCVDLCPTGALMEKRDGRPVDRLDWQTSTTHCVHCGCGCELELKLKGERLVWIGDSNNTPPAWASTCKQGRFRTFDALWHGERLLKPMARLNGHLQEVSWRKAIEVLLDGFGAIHERRGPRALGALASPRSTTESHYLLQKWMRVGWKSHNLDFPGREVREKLFDLTRQYDGMSGLHQKFGGLGEVGAIFLCGDNIEEVAPVAATMVRRAAKKRGIPVWQLSTRPDSLTPFATLAVHASPEGWREVFEGLAGAALHSGKVSEELLHKAGIHSRVMEEALARTTPPTQVSQENWEALKTAFADAPSVAFLFPEALLGSDETADAAEAIVRLAVASGHANGKHGAGIYALTPEINSTGALLMGVSPNWLPGLRDLTDADARRSLMQCWQIEELSNEPAPSLEMALESQQIHGLFVQDAARLLQQAPAKWKKLLGQVKFLALQESIPSQTLEHAHVVLPAAAFGEQDGTVINFERRPLPLKQVFSPRGKSLPDWQALSQIMATQGLAFPREIAAIHEEINLLLPGLFGSMWDKEIQE